MQGLNQDGSTVPVAAMELPYDVDQPRRYLGFYRHGSRVIFAYRIGDTEYLDAPSVVAGKFHRVVAPCAATRIEICSPVVRPNGRKRW